LAWIITITAKHDKHACLDITKPPKRQSEVLKEFYAPILIETNPVVYSNMVLSVDVLKSDWWIWTKCMRCQIFQFNTIEWFASISRDTISFKRSTRDSLHSFTVSISQAIVLTKRANEESLNERTTSCKWTHVDVSKVTIHTTLKTSSMQQQQQHIYTWHYLITIVSYKISNTSSFVI